MNGKITPALLDFRNLRVMRGQKSRSTILA